MFVGNDTHKRLFIHHPIPRHLLEIIPYPNCGRLDPFLFRLVNDEIFRHAARIRLFGFRRRSKIEQELKEDAVLR